MRYQPPLIPAILIRRYKRFLADVTLDLGEEITVHTPNTGSMMGCSDPGSGIWLRDSNNPKRKYRYSCVMTENSDGILIGVDTMLPNRLVTEAIQNGTVKELQGYAEIKQEVPYGRESSRIDLLLKAPDKVDCYVEIKNVTASTEKGVAIFPDAVTKRGTKHLRELIEMVKEGRRAIIFFCIQRTDARSFRPADEIDPEYGDTLRRAVTSGVEALAYRAEISAEGVELKYPVPLQI
ncbi:MAG: DNA/RNA nuclease SfsA [Gammaproteobacteria bacterium]|nr:DNA/RNA nuclease SfsA [Gammaproteobacteria bacterium]